MIRQIVFGAGLLLLTALPSAAQTASKVEKEHPLEAPNDENPAYRRRMATKDYTGISKDPQYRTTGASTTNTSSTSRPAANPADTTAKTPAGIPPDKKEAEKPKQN